MVKKAIQPYLPIPLSWLAWGYLQIVARTSRVEIQGTNYLPLIKNKKQPIIIAVWHNRLMLPLFYFRHLPVTTLVSKSQDGELISQTMNRFGLNTVRGSASRNGAEGLLGLLRQTRRGVSVAITPDGPRGPRETIQPGIVHLAKMSGLPIVPLTLHCSRHYRVHSWDRTIIPFPFSRIMIIFGSKIMVNKEDNVEEKILELQTELDRTTQIVDERMESG